jgi:hypothetical protein
MMVSGVTQVGQGIIDPSLKHRNRPRKTLPVEHYELLGHNPSTLLAPDLEDRLERSWATSSIEVVGTCERTLRSK